MAATLLDILSFLGIIVVGILIWAALSPFEMLGWWAGWFGDKIYDEPIPSDGLVRIIHPDADSYILFLSGVGRTSSKTLSYRERGFLERLARALPRTVIIDDLFPYSVNNLALTGQPIFARLWRQVLRWKQNGPSVAGNLINLRNIFQILMSADKRYGPLFNQGVAEVMMQGLLRYQYDPKSKIPVILVASSGAAQIAVGVTTYLREWIQAPVYTVGIGGVFGSDPGLLVMDQLYQLLGTRDSTVRWSNLDPGRWSIIALSNWNRARRQGKVTEISMGPMCHTGRGSYLDAKTMIKDGQTFVDKTVDTISDIVGTVTNRTPATQISSPSV
ncbi:hypothetical protein KFU94_46955 [Chloroflexi bacterium TSY]|nr:hypothetical protein [Chloroflexi bacterium TSY]